MSQHEGATHETKQPAAGEHGHEGQHDHTGPTVMLFIIFGLLLGGILREINKKTKLPYTPMLLVTGIFLGYARQSLGVVGDSTSIIEKLNPHMILLIFIPTLLFESAFNCDWHVFRKSLVNILILAAPGVLWGAILIGICFKVILLYPDSELTWYQAFTLGCVLSATDPVAVVALLKQLGASVRFNTLVQGESLMNDGTAMVFFMLFLDLAKGNSSSAVGVIGNFVRIGLGGPLLGILVGIFMSIWIKRIIRDHVLAINVTFIGAYLTFYIAEYTWVKVSGILAVVCLGLYMSAVGKRKIYPQSQHAMHNVWSYAQYGCQTLIFILTGIVVGVQMIQQSTIRFTDWLRMFFFWFLMIGLRALMVLTFYPFIQKIGYGLSKKELVVLIYGGLRGALGLCLSLIIGVDDELPQRFRQITVFYMCGMAMLTIVVNGLTCGKVVNYVDMISYPQIKRKLLKRSIKTVISETQQKYKQLKNQPDLAYANWKEVEQIANVRKLGEIFHERSTFLQQRRQSKDNRDSLINFKKNQILQEVRFRFTRYLNKIYWQLYEEGQISEESIRILSNCCDIINDNPQLKLAYFAELSKNFTMESVSLYMKLKDTAIIGSYFSRLLVNKVYFAYEITTSFIESCQETIHVFKQKFPINHESMHHVLQQAQQNIDLATAYISTLQTSYPTIMQSVHTVRATTILLKNKKNSLKKMFNEGFIDENDYLALRKQIDHGLIEVQIHNYKLEEINFNTAMTQFPLFSFLSTQQILRLRQTSSDITFKKGATIQYKDVQMKYLYIVASGTVHEQFDKFKMIRGLGCMLNPHDFIYKQPSKCVIKAKTQVKLMQIQEKEITQLLDKHSDFRKKWFKSMFIYCLKLGRGLEFLEKTFSEKQLRRVIEGSQIKILKPSETFFEQNGAYVFEGQVKVNNSTYAKGHFISKGQTIQALTQSTVLMFRKIVGLEIEQERISVLNQ